jgi:hypothetical protein
MLSFAFRDRVAVAVTANAGTYAMPDLSTPHSAPWQLDADHSLAIRQRRDPPAAPCLWFRAQAPAKGRS